MRNRWLVIGLTASLLLNAVLLIAWLLALRPPPSPHRTIARRPIVTNLLRPLRTNLVFQPKLLTWRDIEADDYGTYIENLRAIGCPERTVRDIIIADVNEVFARRRAAELVTPEQQWWRSEPDPEMTAAAAAKRAELENERRSLLTLLLGPDWASHLTEAEGEGELNPLDGPVLGELPTETRWRVRQVERRLRARLDALAATAETGNGLSGAELAQAQEEARAELAQLLTPAQLEEYLLRYSPNAQRLRQQLRGFEATPEEFRTLFRAVDAIDTELLALANRTDPASQRQRAELAARRETELQRTLGDARYTQYRLNQDPVFQQTRSTAERIGVGPEKLIPFYQLNQAAEEERQRVVADSSLSAEEQARELAELYQQRLDSLRLLLGEEAFRRLQSEGLP